MSDFFKKFLADPGVHVLRRFVVSPRSASIRDGMIVENLGAGPSLNYQDDALCGWHRRNRFRRVGKAGTRAAASGLQPPFVWQRSGKF